jgi:Predicted membrane protein
MPVLNLVGPAQYPLECAGVFAFALSGALLAVGKDFDFFGTVILAGAAGLGGGLFRDLVLGVRPVAFTDVGFYAASAAAALIVFFWTDIRSYDRAWAVFDAAALGLASTTGTIKSLGHGLEPAPAIALGICTAAGGGCLSSLLAHEVPAVPPLGPGPVRACPRSSAPARWRPCTARTYCPFPARSGPPS